MPVSEVERRSIAGLRWQTPDGWYVTGKEHSEGHVDCALRSPRTNARTGRASRLRARPGHSRRGGRSDLPRGATGRSRLAHRGTPRAQNYRKDAAGTEDAYAWAMSVKFALLLTLAAMGACGPNEPAATQGSLADPSVRAKLRVMALQASSANGVPSPKTMLGVYSSDDEAAQEIISGDIVNDHVPVYVIEVTGGPFTCNSCSVPPRRLSSAGQCPYDHGERADLPGHGLRHYSQRA